jgi:hypothetical protein
MTPITGERASTRMWRVETASMSAASGTDNKGLGFRLRFALAASELLIVTPILTAIQADPYGPMTRLQ